MSSLSLPHGRAQLAKDLDDEDDPYIPYYDADGVGACSTVYYYRMRAVNDAGVSDPSVAVAVSCAASSGVRKSRLRT